MLYSAYFIYRVNLSHNLQFYYFKYATVNQSKMTVLISVNPSDLQSKRLNTLGHKRYQFIKNIVQMRKWELADGSEV